MYGVFSISPGLSGGVLSVKLGDYKKVLSIINSKKFTFDNIKYLLCLLIGFVCGSILFSQFINYLYTSYSVLFKYVIFAINLYLLLNITFDNKINIIKLLKITIISMVIVLLLKLFDFSIVLKNIYILFIFSGIIFSFSKVFPGVSGTSFLINIGFYRYLLLFFSNPLIVFKNFYIWFLFWLSFLLSSIVFIKYICNHDDETLYIVIIMMIINLVLLIS